MSLSSPLRLDYVIRDVLLFSVIAIFAGFFLDTILPSVRQKESPWETVLLILLQLITSAVLCFLFHELYGIVFHESNSNVYFGFTFFIVVFFGVQIQLYDRLMKLYKSITGQQIVHYYL